uniref:Glycosyltransferase 61 catalytic domain-containing protein n=1 Tax=Ananas comosus var. bracteatus TaxID=296719 RepID=A0A6V7PRL2_ANACO|nr:unnamed protein product [Ananas comosus var. bracteatus]
MVKHHHRIYVLQLRKSESEQSCQHHQHHHLPPVMYYYEDGLASSKIRHAFSKPGMISLRRRRLVCLLSSLALALLIFFCSSSSPPLCPLLYSCGVRGGDVISKRESRLPPPPCSSRINNTICCDRTALRTDICFMRGDVRTQSSSNSILLLPSSSNDTASYTEQRIRPYTRKWEASVMSTIDELTLRRAAGPRCDVRHEVPAVVFSTGGYTGNVYHEFNDGIIPLYITARQYNRKVVFLVLEYHDWWVTKYGDVVSRLSDYPPVDFSGDRRTHCFPEVVVGLRIHDELTVDAARMPGDRTVRDFRRLLDEAYKGRIRYIERVEERRMLSPRNSLIPPAPVDPRKPRLVIVSRTGSRVIENEAELVRVAEETGFQVQVLRPERTTELCKIYRALNYSDAMIGVHGAAMTHFLFMRPGKVFIQIVPLGTDWAAATYYGEPAKKMGLWYTQYKILPKESSLSREYPRADPVLTDPESVAKRGWEVTKKVYLDRQNVRLDLERFQKRLVRAHQYLISSSSSRKKRHKGAHKKQLQQGWER